MAKIQHAEMPAAEHKFTKAQLLSAKRYSEQRRILDAVLQDGRRYSHTEAADLIEKFKESKVK